MSLVVPAARCSLGEHVTAAITISGEKANASVPPFFDVHIPLTHRRISIEVKAVDRFKNYPLISVCRPNLECEILRVVVCPPSAEGCDVVVLVAVDCFQIFHAKTWSSVGSLPNPSIWRSRNLSNSACRDDRANGETSVQLALLPTRQEASEPELGGAEESQQRAENKEQAARTRSMRTARPRLRVTTSGPFVGLLPLNEVLSEQ